MTAATDFCDSLKSLARQSVTVKARSSVNNYGEPVYVGAGTSYSAYVQRMTTSDRDDATDEKLVEYTAYIPSTTLTVSIVDQVVTPDGLTRPIIHVDQRFDEYGQQAVVLSLGKSRRM